MSTLTTEPPQIAAGEGWHADIYPNHMIVTAAPREDAISTAVGALCAATQLRFWSLEWIYENEAGWDVYLFERTG